MKLILPSLALLFPLFAGPPSAPSPTTNGTPVEYQAGSVTAHGYLALPQDLAPEKTVPGIIVIHEWWGHNDYARSRADQLAKLGYAALAIDMYGEGKSTTHPKDASAFASEAVSQVETMKERFLAGMKVLQDHPQVDGEKIVSIGYCMGGMISLQMAALNIDHLLAVASFHGALNIEIPAETETIQPKILVCHGEDDSFLPAELIASFREQMKTHQADLAFESYPGAVHGFTNPGATALGKEHGIGIAYQKEADEKSWQALTKLLETVFAD